MIHQIKQEQWLPISLQEAWDFFATPHNLNALTPKEVQFVITSDPPEKMYEGLIITYPIKPAAAFWMDWCSEITHIRELSFFVDVQRSGPYKLWHHEHHFEEKDGGVLMTDIVHYEIGKSILGWIAGKVFVHRKLKSIFEGRRRLLCQLFPDKCPL